MSGILDKKSRIIDALLTSEGRRQMAEGTFEVSYATFADTSVAYESDSVEGHVDPTKRLYFEACNLPQDQVVFEADDNGYLIPVRPGDITAQSFTGKIKETYVSAIMSEGKLYAKERQYGSRLRMPSLKAKLTSKDGKFDTGCGFIYSGEDKTLTASIVVNERIKGYKFTPPSVGQPYFAEVGMSENITAEDFAKTTAKLINLITDASGPQVSASYVDDYVHLEYNTYPLNLPILKLTGSLSSPIEITSFALGGRDATEEIEAENFSSQIVGILTSSFDNFVELGTIATIDSLFNDGEFTLNKNEISFNVEKMNSKQLSSAISLQDLDSIDSVFSDEKMSHLENFMYLPPIVKISDTIVPDKSNLRDITPYLLGNYPSWGDNERVMPLEKFRSYLKDYETTTEDIYFTNTSNNNNIICQLFEVANGAVKKLDVVEFHNPTNLYYKRVDRMSLYGTEDKIFFAGKVFADSKGTTCYVNMFTLVFSSDEEESGI